MQLGQKLQQSKHSKIMGNKYNLPQHTMGNKKNSIVSSPTQIIENTNNNNKPKKSILEK